MQDYTSNIREQLDATYEKWCKENKLEHLSADDLQMELIDKSYETHQKHINWLENFIEMYEKLSDLEWSNNA